MAKLVVVVTPEAAVSNPALHLYTGGLGTYIQALSAGTHRLRDELGMRLIVIGILPTLHYKQVARDGKMVVEWEEWSCKDYLQDPGILFQMSINGCPTWVKAFQVPPELFGTGEMFLLTTNIPQNDHLARLATQWFYGGPTELGGNMERAITESLILGYGSVEIPRILGLKPNVFHVNEAHAVFNIVYRVFEHMEAGKTFEQAVRMTRARTVFTTHTPRKEGNPEYPIAYVARLGGFPEDILAKIAEDSVRFHSTAVALRLCRKANAVSGKHLDTGKQLWSWVKGAREKLIAITNGGDEFFWQDRYADVRSSKELAQTKRVGKRQLLREMERATGKILREDVLTIVRGCRWVEYKRLWLPFDDIEWISAHLHAGRLQLILGGKPHPDDKPMQNLWNKVFRLSGELPGLALLPNYELREMQIFKNGADAWLNMPRVPEEACGTSGMGAGMCGAINISTPDGWMPELDAEHWISFGSSAFGGPHEQDLFDARDFRRAIDDALIPLYYGRKRQWYAMAYAAMREIGKKFSAERMAREYHELLYFPGKKSPSTEEEGDAEAEETA